MVNYCFESDHWLSCFVLGPRCYNPCQGDAGGMIPKMKTLIDCNPSILKQSLSCVSSGLCFASLNIDDEMWTIRVTIFMMVSLMGKWSTSSPSSPMSSSPPSLSWDCKRCSLSAAQCSLLSAQCSLSSAHLFYFKPACIHCDCHPGWFCRWYHRLLSEPGLGTTLQRF